MLIARMTIPTGTRKRKTNAPKIRSQTFTFKITSPRLQLFQSKNVMSTKDAGTRRPRDVEMTARGKPGKPKASFPSFPPSLEIAKRFPHSHIFDDCYTLKQNQITTAPQSNGISSGSSGCWFVTNDLLALSERKVVFLADHLSVVS